MLLGGIQGKMPTTPCKLNLCNNSNFYIPEFACVYCLPTILNATGKLDGGFEKMFQ
jgi:hypothetical protein